LGADAVSDRAEVLSAGVASIPAHRTHPAVR
jgi:hypothetical protein